MANSLTQFGQRYMLKGDVGATDGAFTRLATKLKLYQSTSTPHKVPGSATWNEVANGFGYSTGGILIADTDWTLALDGANYKVTLADQVWTAVGGSIANIAGAYVTDASDNVMAWYERAGAVTISSGDTYTATGLLIELG